MSASATECGIAVSSARESINLRPNNPFVRVHSTASIGLYKFIDQEELGPRWRGSAQEAQRIPSSDISHCRVNQTSDLPLPGVRLRDPVHEQGDLTRFAAYLSGLNSQHGVHDSAIFIYAEERAVRELDGSI
jgi:hypothetical protein